MAKPFIFVTPEGVQWAGMADDLGHAWSIALGWPSNEEIDDAQAGGCFVVPAVFMFRNPIDGFEKFVNQVTGSVPRDHSI